MEKAKVWEEHNKELNSFVLSRIRDRDLSKDIMQDIYIKMHHNFEKIHDSLKRKAWLFAIARNVISDHFRKQKRSVPDKIGNDNEANTSNKKFERCLVPHINKLPLIYKEAFIKVELANCSQLQLARELNISYSGAKSRVQRAKQLLKKYFRECCNITSDKYGNIITYSEKHSCKTC